MVDQIDYNYNPNLLHQRGGIYHSGARDVLTFWGSSRILHGLQYDLPANGM